LEDTDGVIIIRISTKNKQTKQWLKEKSTKGQTNINKTYTSNKDRVTQTSLKPRVNTGAPKG